MSDFKADVIVIAGTYDAREIISELLKLNINIAATVTTKFGDDLIEKHSNLEVFQKKLTAQGMTRMIKKYEAKCVIDASHPFAIEASTNAMRACEWLDIQYLRYEREQAKQNTKYILNVKNFEDAAKQASMTDGNILLTVGSKNLDVFFQTVSDFSTRLFVRVLPDSETISKCEAAGLSRGNIIAMKGPFSKEFNIALLKHIDAKLLISKDSGIVGGTEEKIAAVEELGIRLILVDRPEVEYKEKVSTIAEVIFWVAKLIEVEEED